MEGLERLLETIDKIVAEINSINKEMASVVNEIKGGKV